MNIPLHSLVICVGPNVAAIEKATTSVPEHEILNVRKVRYDLVGDSDRQDIDAVVFSEIHRRVHTKLRLGERAVVVATNLRKESRLALTGIGETYGVPIIYLVVADPTEPNTILRQRFLSAERDILNGDEVATVLDTRRDQPFFTKKISDPFADIRTRYSGITIVGDVHGELDAFNMAYGWARSRNHFLISLGDIIDYGYDTLDVADRVYDLVMDGKAALVIGNHERKIARWIDQTEKHKNAMRLSDGNRVTIDALEKLSHGDREKWEGRFRGLISYSGLSMSIKNVHMVHAAVHPQKWSTGDVDFRANENFSLYGEIETLEGNEYSAIRTYKWVDAIPATETVVVGHDARSKFSPVVVTNKNGGKAIFLDTGSGKGGRLSSVDFKFEDDRLRLENFNIH
jgi:protein phosphatase